MLDYYMISIHGSPNPGPSAHDPPFLGSDHWRRMPHTSREGTNVGGIAAISRSDLTDDTTKTGRAGKYNVQIKQVNDTECRASPTRKFGVGHPSWV
jgi:hypothetical protein